MNEVDLLQLLTLFLFFSVIKGGIGDSGITASDSNISTASATTSSASSSSQRPSRCERRDASHQPDIIAEHEDDDQLIDEHTLDSVMNRYISI